MSPPLPRYTTQPEPNWHHIVDTTTDELTTSTYDPSGGNLRGIPAIGRGVDGATPGTNPEDCIDRLDASRRPMK
jgi:hypothetical protein